MLYLGGSQTHQIIISFLLVLFVEANDVVAVGESVGYGCVGGDAKGGCGNEDEWCGIYVVMEEAMGKKPG